MVLESSMLLTLAVIVSADGVPTVVSTCLRQVTMAKGGPIINDQACSFLPSVAAGELKSTRNEPVFIIVEGEATFATGGRGQCAGHRAASCSERSRRRGSPSDQGRCHHHSGEAPHWFKEVPTKTIAYYAVNTEP